MIRGVGEPQPGVALPTSSAGTTDTGNTGRWLREMEQAEFADWFVRDSGGDASRNATEAPADRKQPPADASEAPPMQSSGSPVVAMEPESGAGRRAHDTPAHRGPQSNRATPDNADPAMRAGVTAGSAGQRDAVANSVAASGQGTVRSSDDASLAAASPMPDSPSSPVLPVASMALSPIAPAVVQTVISSIESSSAWLMREVSPNGSTYFDTLLPPSPSPGGSSGWMSSDVAGAWRKQVTHAYLGPDGVTIWLRDKDLGDAKASSVVRSISEWAAESGIAVKQIHLNGRRIYERREYKQKF